MKILKNCLTLTKKLKNVPDGKTKHFSFICNKNKIISVGWNDGWTTHPFCHKLGYRFSAIHSEVSAILKFKYKKKKLRECFLVNTRINRFGEIGMSKPCKICQSVLDKIDFKKIYYTDQNGSFVRMK